MCVKACKHNYATTEWHSSYCVKFRELQPSLSSLQTCLATPRAFPHSPGTNLQGLCPETKSETVGATFADALSQMSQMRKGILEHSKKVSQEKWHFGKVTRWHSVLLASNNYSYREIHFSKASLTQKKALWYFRQSSSFEVQIGYLPSFSKFYLLKHFFKSPLAPTWINS